MSSSCSSHGAVYSRMLSRTLSLTAWSIRLSLFARMCRRIQSGCAAARVGRRSKNESAMHAIRGGTIVGEHEVIFAGNDEIITVSHSARSKSVFATGSINAAIFLNGKAPGMYSMKDLVAES